MHNKTLLAALALGILVSGTAQAHDAWVAFSNGAYRVVYGHPGRTEGFDPVKLKQVAVYSPAGAVIEANQTVQEKGVLIDPNVQSGMITTPGMTTVVFDNGFWTKTSDTEKSVNESKSKHPDYLEAFHSMKYGKSIFAWSDAAKQAKGLEFEVVPLQNPWTLKAGEMLPVQVLYQGKPLADAVIGSSGHDDANKIKTDADGKAQLKVFGGENVIVARHRVPLPENPDADAMVMGANLYFSL